MGAGTKAVGGQMVLHGSRHNRNAGNEPRKQKKKTSAANGFQPLTQEGGEAEDDFGGPSVVDLQTEAALVEGRGDQKVEFLTGALIEEEKQKEQESIEERPRKKRKKEQAGRAGVVQAEKSDGGSVQEPEKKNKKKKNIRSEVSMSGEHSLLAKKGSMPGNIQELETSGAQQDNPRALPLPDVGSARMEQADWFAGCLRGHFGETLSSLEQAEVTEQHVASGSGSGAPLAPSLKMLFGSRWQEQLCRSSLEEGHEAGSPRVLVVSASAKRANDVIKTLGEFNGGCRVAKLFAKHFKVEEQVALLKNRVNIAAGTPNRLLKLAELSALSLECLEVLVLDLHRDAKGLTVVDIKETKNDFWTFFHEHVAKRVTAGSCRLFFSI